MTDVKRERIAKSLLEVFRRKYTTVAWLCNGVWISDNDILCGTAVAWMPIPKYEENE